LNKIIFNLFWWLNINLPAFPSRIIPFLERREFLSGLMKIPAVLFDLALFYLLYLFSKKIDPKGKNNKLLIFIFVLLNPILIYLSSLWGQVDSVNLFFILLSVYLLLYTQKAFVSLSVFTLALLVKPTGLIFLPVYMIYFYKKFGLKILFFAFIISNIIFFASFLLFYKNGNIILFPYITYWQRVIGGQSMINISNSAFNFWSINPQFMKIKDIVKVIGPVSYKIIGFGMVVISYLYIVVKYFKNINIKNISSFFYAMFLTGYSYVMFSTRMHERYFVYLLPFIFLMGLKEKIYLKWTLFLSVLFFLNIYSSWMVVDVSWMSLKNTTIVSLLSIINFLTFLYFLFKINRRFFVKSGPFFK